MMIVYQGNNYQIRVGDLLSVAGVPTSTQVIAGTGMTGGGQLTGNVTLSVAPKGINSTLINDTGVTAGVYGNATNIPVFTVDSTGRVTAATTVPATGGSGSFVPTTTQVIAGNGLTGGGALSGNVTLTANFSSASPQAGFQTGSAGVANTLSRGDHKHPAVDLSADDQVDNILGLNNGGTARSLVMQPGAVIWSGADGLYVGPAGVAGQVLLSGGTSQYTWSNQSGLNVGQANNINGGASNRVLYQTGVGTTGFIPAPLFSDTLLKWTGSAFEWGTIAGAGTVTSVGLALPTDFAVSGSPVTSAGVLTAAWLAQPANRVFSGPTSGVDATPTFRSLTNQDIPSALSGKTITGSTLNSTTIGATTPSSGVFTTVDATDVTASLVDATNLEVMNLKAKDGTAAGSIADTTGVVTLNSAVLTTAAINAGAINNTTVGATTATTVRGTTITATVGFSGSLTGNATTATTATNIAGGAAGSIPYQTGSGATSLLAAGTGVLVAGSTPSYSTTPTLTGTNFSAIPNAALTNSSVTLGTTAVSLGATSLTLGGLTSVAVTQDPTTNLQLATKQYVDTIASTGIHFHDPVYVESPNTAGNLTATYVNGGTNTNIIQIANGTDITFFGYTPVVGDQFLTSTGNGLTAGTQYWIVALVGSACQISLTYGGAIITGLTNGGVTLPSLVNPGVGATLTNAGTQVALTIDGVLMTTTKRVLIYNQTNAFENGVYTVTTVGDGSTNWVLTRATDANTYSPYSSTSLGQGDAFFVQAGATGAGETYAMTTSGSIFFGQTNISFVQISSAQVYSAGTGLTLTGTQFSLTAPVVVANGGTGLTSFTAGDLPYYTSGTALSKLGIGANTYMLTSNGSTPGWTDPASVTVGNATAAVSATTATNLAGGAASQIPYQSGSGATTFLANGTAGQVLTSAGSSAPAWGGINGGTF
jgi:hypothetical protein